MTGSESVLAMISGPCFKDNCMDVLCPQRWLHPIVAKTSEWWHLVPLFWPVVVREWGVEERGMMNKIPPGTWESCHDWRIALQ